MLGDAAARAVHVTGEVDVGRRCLADESTHVLERGLVGDSSVQFVDIREAHEVAQSGTLPGAVHAPRGFLEFLADPESPMHKKELAGRKLVLFCASGGRSTLAAKTLYDMGIDACHIAGGIAAWSTAGGPIQK